jgi:hypothetical protein
VTPEDVIAEAVEWREGAKAALDALTAAGYTVISTEELQRERGQSRCAGCGEVDVGALCGWCYEN